MIYRKQYHAPRKKWQIINLRTREIVKEWETEQQASAYLKIVNTPDMRWEWKKTLKL